MKLTKEIKIALVAIVGILIMYFGINFLKGINLFSTNNAYYMTFVITFRDWALLAYLCGWLQGGYCGCHQLRLQGKRTYQSDG